MAKIDMSMVPAELKSETGKYKPGHDAKHVSILLADLKAEAKESKAGTIKVASAREAAKQLPTPHLREKLANAVERFNNPPAKAERKPATVKPAKEAPAPVEEEEAEPIDFEESDIVRTEERADVKSGRWFYPARTAYLEDGRTVTLRNSARDGSGDWVVA